MITPERPLVTRHRRFVGADIGGSLREALDDFLQLTALDATQDAVHRQLQMVSRYYDVVTKFYEYGWGKSFHFAPRRFFPWYRSLQGRDFSLASLTRVPAGRWFTATVTTLLERLRGAPAGTAAASAILNGAADVLVEAGEEGIFTPSFLVHARKPVASSQ